MRRAMLFCAALAPAVHAQVVECPKFYPWQDTPMAEVPYKHKGQGFAAKSRLAGAGMFTGEININAALVGDRRKVKGGWDAQFGFEPGERRWLVCSYGDGSVTWWEQLDPTASNCSLRTRDGGPDPMSVQVTCK